MQNLPLDNCVQKTTRYLTMKQFTTNKSLLTRILVTIPIVTFKLTATAWLSPISYKWHSPIRTIKQPAEIAFDFANRQSGERFDVA